MTRDTRFVIIMPILMGSVTLTGIAFTRIPQYQPPPLPWIGIAAVSTTIILMAAIKGCIDWVYEGRP